MSLGSAMQSLRFFFVEIGNYSNLNHSTETHSSTKHKVILFQMRIDWAIPKTLAIDRKQLKHFGAIRHGSKNGIMDSKMSNVISFHLRFGGAKSRFPLTLIK